MRLRASVRTVTGKAKHLQGVPTTDEVEIVELSDPVAVELVEEDGAFSLLRLDEDGQCTADTWHATAEEAKAQASFEFGIEEADWKETETRH
jgi:hypothetical protein